MSLRCIVKVDSVSDLSVARYAAGMGVSYLGLPLEANKAHMEAFAEIAEWVCGVDWVGEWAGNGKGLSTACEQYALRAIELSFHQIASCAPLPAALKLFLRCSVQENVPSVAALPPASYYILAGRLADYRRQKAAIEVFCQHQSVLLAWTGDAHALDEALSWGVKGFTLRGQAEERPGWTHYDRLAEVLERLEIDE